MSGGGGDGETRQPFRFAPVTRRDEALLRAFLSTPDARRWWGDPDVEIALIYEGEANGQSRGFVVHGPDGPFAYIQSWPCDAQPEEAIGDEPWIRDQSPGTLGIDMVIGRPDHLGKGLGTAALKAFCARLFAEGAPRLFIDPDAANVRAARAYLKAGFRQFDSHTDEDGTTLLMEMLPPEGPDG